MSLDIILFAINHPKMTSDKNHMCDILAVYAKTLVNAYLDSTRPLFRKLTLSADFQRFLFVL